MSRGTLARCLGIGLIGAAAMASVQASTVTFEDVTPNLFAEGDTFTSGGYDFRVGAAGLGFGIVDNASAFAIATPPGGTSGNFFGALNDSGVTMSQAGHTIALAGFDYGFISPVPGIGGPSPGALLAFWTDDTGASGTSGFDFGDADASGNWSMRHAGAASFGDALPSAVRSVTFIACLYDLAGACVFPADNLAQFALDNITIPVPATWALLGAGLLAGASRRRKTSS